MGTSFPLYWIPLFPLLGAAFNLLLGRKVPRWTVHLAACGAVFAALVVSMVAFFYHLYPAWAQMTHGVPHGTLPPTPLLHNVVFDWIVTGEVAIKFGLMLDPLSAVMIMVVTFVGFLIHVYSTGYMSHEKDYARFFAYLNLFTGAMLILVLGDNLAVLFVGWEGVGACSYLLIGFWYDKSGTETYGDENATAGKKAFIVNRIGDLAFVIGMFILFGFCGTLNFGELATKIPELSQSWNPLGLGAVTVAGAAALFLFIGATGKSAQVPLYVWLPDAMAGPTPVSALIHAATMVTAGVYMIARLNFVYMLSPAVMALVAIVGALTAFVAATIGFAQNDIKKVLAYSTVSQLGYMFVGVGMGAYAAGVFHLFTHAFFKACLFLGAGAVIHALAGDQDMRNMGGLRKKLPTVHWTMLLSTIAIAGVFPFSGFFSKDEILWKTITTANPALGSWGYVVYVLALAGALCTAFYMFRLYYMTFSGDCRASDATLKKFHPPAWNMTMPLVVLAIGATVLGLLGLPHVMGPNLFHHWLAPVVDVGHHVAMGAAAAVAEKPEMAHNAGLEWGLMALSLCIAVGGILFARKMYNTETSGTIKRFVERHPTLHRVVYNKYFVDEIYFATVVRAVKDGAAFCFKVIDRFFIDTIAVRGGAAVVDLVGKAGRFFQTGNLQHYLAVFIAGVAVIVFWVSQPPDDFKIVPEGPLTVGQKVVFDAGRGFAHGGRSLEYRWDFNGDGTWDQPPAKKGEEAKYSATANGSFSYDEAKTYKVILEVRDLRWGTKSSSTATVVVRPSTASIESKTVDRAGDKKEVAR